MQCIIPPYSGAFPIGTMVQRLSLGAFYELGDAADGCSTTCNGG
jgi:hypothetical protein